MIYIGVRIILIIVLVLLTIWFVKKVVFKLLKKLYSKGKIKNVKRVSKLMVIIPAVIVILVSVCSFYPYEESFLRFQTVDQSMAYSIPLSLTYSNEVIDAGDCQFIMSNRDNNYVFHSVSVYDDGLGLINFKSHTKLYVPQTFYQNEDEAASVSCVAVYNENRNKTCYVFKSISFFISDYEIYSDQNHRFTRLHKKELDNGIIKNTYYLIENGAVRNDFSMTVNGKKVKL